MVHIEPKRERIEIRICGECRRKKRLKDGRNVGGWIRGVGEKFYRVKMNVAEADELVIADIAVVDAVVQGASSKDWQYALETTFKDKESLLKHTQPYRSSIKEEKEKNGFSSFTTTSSSSSSSTSILTYFHKSPPRPSSPLRFICKSQTLPLVLHDALDASGLDTKHARAAREGFRSQIGRLGPVEWETSISVNRRIDLAKTALYISAEDDSLISHSSVPLPVDAFIEGSTTSPWGSAPITAPPSPRLLPRPSSAPSRGSCTKISQGFRRAKVSSLSDPRALYLHSVLTHRSGSAVMLSLIYAELLKMLRLWSLLSFDVEIYCPLDLVSLPRGYNKKKSQASDQPHILTTQALLVQMLKNLKDAFWPFQNDPTKSLFLRAAHAAKCTSGPTNMGESGFERASAKAAQHRLERGVWTSVRLGDMRRALSALGCFVDKQLQLVGGSDSSSEA
ncbi:hypothetical protein Sjap_012888 [Stephania japonica]|uniref:Protein SirB1 N-terminal domain-containing protein n=1 Tax=Stephania japonica TaxID=461633 RepID=A0AAP0IZD2_9MAGN